MQIILFRYGILVGHITKSMALYSKINRTKKQSEGEKWHWLISITNKKIKISEAKTTAELTQHITGEI